MARKLMIAAWMLCVAAAPLLAQEESAEDAGALVWRRAGEQVASPAADYEEELDAPVTQTSASVPIQDVVPKSDRSTVLPNDAGQIWRDYDISSYTARVTTTNRPEQAILDWILRETGYEAWHTGPLSVLSAGPRTLRVYHTPEMHQVVADLVDRFVSSEAATYTFSLRVITLDSPNWRAMAQQLLQPVPVQTPGMNAWMLAKEDAAILLGRLRRRNDFREHSSPYLVVNNGQSTLVSAMRSRPYVRDVAIRPELPAGFEPTPGQVDEGFNLEFSPLLSADRRMIDAVIRCDVDQVEKMIPLMIDVPTRDLPRQRTKIEAPQITHYRFHERFRWPIERVLVVGMGMVALPIPVDGAPMVPGVPLPIGSTPARADLLVFIECKGQSRPATATDPGSPVSRSSQRSPRNYRGRY